jgi:hypothetical protein
MAAVHVVVGMHEPALPARPAEDLGRAIGEHLVHVHVALGARAGLPHHQRELVRPAAREHLVGRGHDGARLLRRDESQALVHRGRGALDPRERFHDLGRHALGGDAEVLEGSLGLGAPQALLRHFDRSEGVPLDAHAFHVSSPSFPVSPIVAESLPMGRPLAENAAPDNPHRSKEKLE